MDVWPDRRERYEALVREVVEPLRRYALRRTDPASAEDAVADALLVMWRRLDDVPVGAELPWSYAVVRRCLANTDRAQRRHRSLVERIARLDRPTEAADPGAPAGPDPAVDRALQRLRPDDREVLRLWAWEDLQPSEIAVVLGVTPNAVSIRLHRAKARLAAELGGATGKTTDRAGQMQVDGTVDGVGGER